ncbi:MAG: signal peptidase I [Planctomycetota bacterium]
MKLTRLTIREYAESLAIAFILAMVIRHFVVEAFRIPTSSMEPTLIGNERSGDRILVSKFQYDLHPPQQWDIVVFKIDEARIDYYKRFYNCAKPVQPDYYERHSNIEWGRVPPKVKPDDNGTVSPPGSPEYVNYVKRLVGLPGQTIQVINGDVFIDGKISRKPPHAEESLLVPVTDDARLSRGGETFFQRWSKRGAKVAPAGAGRITLDGSAAECSVRYLGQIEDYIQTSRDGPSQFRSLNVVGDLKLAFRFTHTGGSGDLICRLNKDDTEYVFVLPLGKQGEAAQIRYAGEVAARAGRPFAPTGEHRIEVSNIDARAILKVDGEVLVSFENNDPGQADAGAVSRSPTERSGAEFGVTGCTAAVRDVSLWRDVYYTAGEEGRRRPKYAVSEPLELAGDEYFMMGDNSPNSFDGRNWGVVKEDSLIGEAFFVFWPLPRWRLIN